MADIFSKDLHRARDVDGFTSTHDSTAAAIGEGLKGVAAILDVGLKASADARVARVSGAVEDSLAEEAKKFQDSNKPLEGDPAERKQAMLVGEPGQGESPEDWGYTPQQHSRMNQLRQGYNQERISRSEFYAKTSAIVQQAIHDNPRFASQIRQRAQDVLGLQPTSAAIALQVEGEKAAEDIQRGAKAKLIEYAVTHGLGVVHTSGPLAGQLDVEATGFQAMQSQQVEHYMETLNKRLVNEKLQRELDAKETGKPPTMAEVQNADELRFTGGHVESGYLGSDTYYRSMMQGIASRAPALIASSSHLKEVKDQAFLLRSELGQAQGMFMGWLEENFHKANLSQPSRERIRNNYLATFKNWEALADGGFGSFQNGLNRIKSFEVDAGYDAWNVAPEYMKAKASLGEPILAAIATTALNTAAGTDIKLKIDGIVMNGIRALTAGSLVGDGQRRTRDYPASQQPQVAEVVGQGATTAARRLVSGEAVEGIDDKNYANFMLDILSSSANTSTVQGVQGLSRHTASMEKVLAVDELAKMPDGAAKAKAIGSGMVQVNAKAIAMIGRSVMKDVHLANQGESFRNREGGGKDTPKWEVVYNADKGLFEAISDAKPSINMMAPLPMPTPVLAAKVRDMNAAMEANKKLAPDYGSDREKAMDPRGLKLAYAKTTGLKITGGEDLVAKTKPKDQEGPTDDENTLGGSYPVGMLETGANPFDKGVFPNGVQQWGTIEVADGGIHRKIIVPTIIEAEGEFDAFERYIAHEGRPDQHFGKFNSEEAADVVAGSFQE